jgi:putative addiction module component (TIGR02574 family)
MTVEDIEAEALKLDPPTRARLAEKLLESLEMLTDAETDALWAEEAQRRDDEIDAGVVTPKPIEEVFRDLRSRLS